jgi:hypothetical protein
VTEFRAHVEKGRIVVDDVTDLPDGAELALAVIDGDEMTDAEVAGLEAQIERGRADLLAGRGISSSALLGDQMAAAGPWQGETEDEILRFLRDARKPSGR